MQTTIILPSELNMYNLDKLAVESQLSKQQQLK